MILETLEIWDPEVMMALREMMVIWDLLDQLDPEDLMAHKEHKVLEVQLDLRE